MASASKSATKEVEPSLMVGPTEDVVQALLETLVYPVLPLRVSNVPPSEDAQKSVAKQMHAVVLLYNYQHRKHKPEMVFLDFVNFCKLAVVVRPPLTAFLKLMTESDTEYELSVTEEAIKKACDTAVALDASRDVPNIEGWPISKVAMLLIDSKKENCMLKFGGVTKGVWSLIEKEIIESGEEKVGDKRKRNSKEASTYDSKFLQLGYDAVKEVTGIGSSDLEVLGTHVTYSLSKKKSAARFYMMRYTGSFSTNEQVPLEFLVERLLGPLAEKVAFGFWKTTPVVEFHHMLPYVGFISSWLSRQTAGPSRDLSERTVKVDNAMEKLNNRCEVADSATKEANTINLGISDTNSDDQKKGFVSGPSRAIGDDDDDDVIDKFNKTNHSAHFLKKEENRTDPEILDKDNSECGKDSLSVPARELKTSDLSKTCPKTEDTSNKLNSKIRVYHHRRKNNPSTPNDGHVREDGASLRVDSSNSYHTQCRDEKVSGDKVDATISSNQNGIAETLVKFEAKTNHSFEGQNLSASEDLQNALALLYRKRQEQYSQICSLEETLALYEDNIARIRDGGDIGLARQCIKSIVSGSYNLLLEHGTQKQDKVHQHSEDDSKSQREKIRLSKIYLPGKSSCQDLEHTCLKNNWRLPRYLIESSDGKFVSYVVVEGKDLKLHSKGGFESQPCEARESAALQMIAQIQSPCV